MLEKKTKIQRKSEGSYQKAEVRMELIRRIARFV
jgi:predicted glycoside hydrolase/deacetylase ChbG (UPF0249 family)